MLVVYRKLFVCLPGVSAQLPSGASSFLSFVVHGSSSDWPAPVFQRLSRRILTILAARLLVAFLSLYPVDILMADYWDHMLELGARYDEQFKLVLLQVLRTPFHHTRSLDVVQLLQGIPILSNIRLVHVLLIVAKFHYSIPFSASWVVLPYLTRYFITYQPHALVLGCRHIMQEYLNTPATIWLYSHWGTRDRWSRFAVYDIVWLYSEFGRGVLSQVLRSLLVFELVSIDYDWSQVEAHFGRLYASQFNLVRSKLFGYQGAGDRFRRPRRLEFQRVQTAIEVSSTEWINSRIHDADSPARIY